MADRKELGRRTLLGGTGAVFGLTALGNARLTGAAPAATPSPRTLGIPFRIFRITFRGRTQVEEGFDSYMLANDVPVDFLNVDVGQDQSRAGALVERIKSLKPDLVLTWGTPVTLQVAGRHDAWDRTRFVTEIPIVFALVSAPVRSGIVRSLEQPGRNVTGVVHVVPTVTQLRAMAAYRSFTRLGVLYTPTEPNSVAIVRDLDGLAAELGFALVKRRFAVGADGRPSSDGVEDLVAEIKAEGADWLYLLPDTFLGANYERVAPTAMELRLPCFGAAERAIRDGGAVAGLISRYVSVGELAAHKATQILLDGLHPSDIPIETLKRFSFIINLPVAQALDFYPPMNLIPDAEFIRG